MKTRQDQIQEIEKNNDFSNPKYNELLMKYYYTEHILRKPLEEWPEAVNRCFKHINPNVYVFMQGHSEFGITGNASLKNWDVKNRLKTLTIPTLVIGAKYDTMDPEHMKWMSTQFPNGQYLYCPNGSHLAMWDDQKVFMDGVINFIKSVDQGKTK